MMTQAGDKPLEKKVHQNQEYVRTSVLDAEVRAKIISHPNLDRTKLQSLYQCCYKFEEYILLEHFLSLIQ